MFGCRISFLKYCVTCYSCTISDRQLILYTNKLYKIWLKPVFSIRNIVFTICVLLKKETIIGLKDYHHANKHAWVLSIIHKFPIVSIINDR